MKILLSLAILTLVFPGAVRAADPKPMDEADAKKLIQSLTRIGICNDDQRYDFTSVQLAPAVKRIVDFSSKATLVYPVRAHYTVDCTTGNHNMRYGEVEERHVEVAATYTFFRDEFGEWTILNSYFDGDQYWSDTQSDLRCRAQRTAYLTYDASGAVGKRRATDTHDWGDCGVRAKDSK